MDREIDRQTDNKTKAIEPVIHDLLIKNNCDNFNLLLAFVLWCLRHLTQCDHGELHHPLRPLQDLPPWAAFPGRLQGSILLPCFGL